MKLTRITTSPTPIAKIVGYQTNAQFSEGDMRDFWLFSFLFLGFAFLPGCSRNTKVSAKTKEMGSTETSIKEQEDPLNPSEPLQQAMLGWRYHAGEGMVQDFAEGVKWYRKAAEQGVALAQVSLGICYVKGEGVDRDFSQAAKWFRMAAEQGDPDGQFRLGICFESGAGTDQNSTQAYMWYNLAAASKNKETAANARRNQAVLARRMSRDEIAEAQRMSREWKKR